MTITSRTTSTAVSFSRTTTSARGAVVRSRSAKEERRKKWIFFKCRCQFPISRGKETRGQTMKVSAGGEKKNFEYTKPRIDEGYNCVVTEKGAIISEDIPSGTYEVSAWWGGTKKNSSTDEKEEFLAPRCDTEKQKGCEVKCEIVEEGCLVCEGLAEGTYRVTNVKDLNEECEVSYDGTSISCDEADVETFDVGDLEMKEKADDHSIRLGG